MLKVDFSEVTAYIEKFQRFQEALPDFFKEFLLQKGIDIIELSKQRTPVDTGALKDSFGLGEENFFSNNTNYKNVGIEAVSIAGNNYYWIKIFNTQTYASFIEFGTRYITAFYMVTISINEVENNLGNDLNEAFKEFCKKWGIA